jgi:hypothetical protein
MTNARPKHLLMASGKLLDASNSAAPTLSAHKHAMTQWSFRYNLESILGLYYDLLIYISIGVGWYVNFIIHLELNIFCF